MVGSCEVFGVGGSGVLGVIKAIWLCVVIVGDGLFVEKLGGFDLLIF